MLTQRMTITYRESVRGNAGKVLSYKVMACDVEIALDVDAAAKTLAVKAARSTSGKSVDGPCIVRRLSTPKQIGENTNAEGTI